MTRSPAVPLTTPLQPPEPVTPGLPAKDLLGRMAAVAGRLQPEWYNPDALAHRLGPDIGAVFSWVRDHIRYEAYSGVLREAEGTLAAGAGNALDRSLLLARLLGVHGVQTRLVSGTLPRSGAERVFQRMFDNPATPASGPPPAAEPSGFLSRVTTRARRDYGAIVGALGATFGEQGAKAREQAMADIERHAWVQALVDGRWVDLDSSFRDATPGRLYGTASSTVDAAPADWYQTVTIRVIAERVEDGTLTSAPALEVTRPAADLVTQQVFLLHLPVAAKRGMGLGFGAAERGDRWTPVLLIDEDSEEGTPIDFGDTESGTGFDALGGGSSSSLVAEWVEFEVRRPDGRRDVSRRAVVDRAGTAWRLSASHPVEQLRPLVRDEHGLLAPAAIHHLMFSAGPRDLRQYGLAVVDAMFPAPDPPNADAPLAEALPRLATHDLAAWLWADEVVIPGLNDDPRIRVFTDAPRIAVVSIAPAPGGELTLTYDLRRDWVCSVARDVDADRLVADRRIWFAALEGALEHESVARDAAIVGGGASAVRSTSALLTSDGAVALGLSDLQRLPQLTQDVEMLARLAATIREGAVVVVPRAALASGAMGWWEVAGNGDGRAVLDGLHMGQWTSALATKSLPPTVPKTINIGEMQSQEEIAKQIKEILKKESPPKTPKGRPGRPPVRAGTPRRGGNEYGTLITVMGTVAVVAATVYATKVIDDRMKAASQAAYDAWNAAEDAKQQNALNAARRP